jgi:predicted phage terminase large subunit-like protein
MSERADQKEYQAWLDLCSRIREQTSSGPAETGEQRQKRIKRLRGNFKEFCHYYLAHYLDSKFGWFHHKAAKEITSNKDIFTILEWPREHAKSVFVDVFMPLFLKARGELDGMILGSANFTKASVLLGDIQAELVSNQRFIADYGEQATIGDWRDGYFTTTDGLGFWAFGRGQSPRGTRKGSKRPNYGAIDDIDDNQITKNLARVKEAVNWILEDFFGALSIKGARFVMAGNRIHKHSILAHMVGDLEYGDPKRKGLTHIKVYAFENKQHYKSDETQGKPAWGQRYTPAELISKMEKYGYRAARREFFHEHIEQGIIFQPEWIQWTKTKPFKNYHSIIAYGDPSFKDTKKSDYKAIVVVGTLDKGYDILYAWVRQTSVSAMVSTFYDLYDEYESYAKYYIESNMLQDMFLDEFVVEGEERGYQMPIRGDNRQKPDKFTRIENLTPLFERGLVRFNEHLRKDPDMQELVHQLLGFGGGAHDDGPDALEGAIHKAQRKSKASKIEPRLGRFAKSSKRKA